MTDSDNKNIKRIEWIDCARGIGMILVIVGHTMSVLTPLQFYSRLTIYSFHMPLFFILSGLTLKPASDDKAFGKNIKRSFKHLMIPFLILFVINTIPYCLEYYQDLDLYDLICIRLFTLIFASPCRPVFFGLPCLSVGIIWFLSVLFLSRALIDLINLKLGKKALVIISVISLFAGYYLSTFSFSLFFALDIVMTVFPLVVFGYFIRDWFSTIGNRWYYLIGFLFIWLLSVYLVYHFTGTHLEIGARRFPLFPVSYIAAVSGSLFVFILSIFICRFKYVSLPLCLVGKYSLYFLFAQSVDGMLSFIWDIPGNAAFKCLIRLAVDLCIVLLIIKVRSLRSCNKQLSTK
ncbi:MAG: acyltransferase family protein [Clostridiales bacterium]|nr:acyltransferase family protein [Clostridiales bacterium]